MGSSKYMPLFETRTAKDKTIYRVFASTVAVGIGLIWLYRAKHIPSSRDVGTRMAWIAIFAAEVWFGLYWLLTQSLRWNCIYRRTFPDRLSQRDNDELPGVDIFVCTADPSIEPPVMVINTVLSVMAYDYPADKLSVYLSDDAGSELTFYALLEATGFSKHWLPYCKKYNVEPRSPAAYFGSVSDMHVSAQSKDFSLIKKLYEDMENKIQIAMNHGRISEEVRLEHEEFSKWDSYSSRHDHDTIVQIIIDGRTPEAKDIEGGILPTLVYLAREKRPKHFHNFKAGAMNALIRVSSEISNGQIILNVDCDMYSNSSVSVRDALCFFMDEQKGNEIAFVQFPQNFQNITKNDIYGNSLRVISEVEFHGMDGYGGPIYCGSGCYHRREILCGKKFSKEDGIESRTDNSRKVEETVLELEGRLKVLASCTYEQNARWGREIGLKYGCPVEDVITGLSIQCQGWKSVYYNPPRKAFLGVAGTTLEQTLVQHKRWSEGDLQILLSKYTPVWYGVGRIRLGLIMGYCTYCLWSPNCFATLYYCIVPSLCLLKDIALFPPVPSMWFLPFAYVVIAVSTYSCIEFLCSGGTILGWWNEQRIWLYKRTSAYLFSVIDTMLKIVGQTELAFVISAKTSNENELRRYNQELMDFGSPSTMFVVLSTPAMLNLLCFIVMVKRMVVNVQQSYLYRTAPLQILLCATLVCINLPLYNAAFFRKDKGRMPTSVTVKSFFLALTALTCLIFLSSKTSL